MIGDYHNRLQREVIVPPPEEEPAGLSPLGWVAWIGCCVAVFVGSLFFFYWLMMTPPPWW